MPKPFRVVRQSLLAVLVLAAALSAVAYVVSWSEVAWLSWGRIDGSNASVMVERGRLVLARTHTATDRGHRSHTLTFTRAQLPDRPLALNLYQSPGMTHLTAGPLDFRHARQRMAALDESFTALCLRLEPLIATLLALTWLTATRARRAAAPTDPAPVSAEASLRRNPVPPVPQP
ncbi:MAG: hypothetical protein AAF078_04705 [Planctomycetota bacterium]